MERAGRESEKNRSQNVLNLLGAISGYPDSLFNYEKNEKDIYLLIRENLKQLNVKQAL